MTPASTETSVTSNWDPRKQVPQKILDLLTPAKINDGHNYNYISAFYQIVSLLKEQKRTGWIDKNKITNPESIADHMYRMSIIAMSLDKFAFTKESNGKTTPDLSQCVKIALIHDIAESLVGDIVPQDPNVKKAEKHSREYKTIQFLSEVIKPYNENFSKEIVDLWLDYEYQRNLEGTIVKDIDKYELLVQTFEYERLHGIRMDEFYNCKSLIKHEEMKRLTDELMRQRKEFLDQHK
ncbi:hypothetical protein FOA43_001846 [Brettanomyces nanus]|uniref:5'-deoxynucleotidase n=1 Tax=Eeniella nana TaxID=13502 RepID=A0A875RZC7_EENNA|nr:uncharacterized protein FOA43_001846 [Brettanomyces nanus]QPG74516.1 hypothetical protein FOA43_001846 [Brettanomyces nanus]